MRYDQHLHSRHSFDSETEPDDNVRRALELGLGGLTFTEHFDTHADEWPACRYDEARYADDIAGLRDRYGERLFIGKGVEICYQPKNERFILDHLERHEFDLVMLSVHWTRRGAIHQRRVWEQLGPVAGTRLYLESVLDAVRWARHLGERHGRVFDVLGHLDLARRYAHRFFNHYDPDDGADIVDEILRTCLAAELVPEINTSTVRVGPGRSMPDAPDVARYTELGGRAMILGSDAHRPEHVAGDFDYAVAVLRQNGITGQAVYRNRRLTTETLE